MGLDLDFINKPYPMKVYAYIPTPAHGKIADADLLEEQLRTTLIEVFTANKEIKSIGELAEGLKDIKPKLVAVRNRNPVFELIFDYPSVLWPKAFAQTDLSEIPDLILFDSETSNKYKTVISYNVFLRNEEGLKLRIDRNINKSMNLSKT